MQVAAGIVADMEDEVAQEVPSRLFTDTE